MRVEENVSLKNLNTFGVDQTARWYCRISAAAELQELFSDPRWSEVPKLILGGGSNMLFTRDFDGLIIHLAIQGISEDRSGDDVIVRAGAGENWNGLVQYCVSREYAGIENLSLIPGSVGASPVQNIGAYGVELSDVFESCRAYDIQTGEYRSFNKSECRFQYRDSIFKGEAKGRFIITDVSLRLSLVFKPNLSYGAIQAELDKRGIAAPGIRDVADVVSAIRVSKLPDPSTIGNAGSFFKNPIIPVDKLIQLQSSFPDIVYFPAGEGRAKLAAGWLIEQCGWKGKVVGNTGTWKNQALVLVNHGGATGNEVFTFSKAIIESVEEKFGVQLEPEVNIF